MVPFTRFDKAQLFVLDRIDHRHAAVVGLERVVADPQIAFVVLEFDAGRLVAGIDVFHDLEGLGIDQRDLVGQRHGHEQLLLVAGLGPVGARLIEIDLREQVGDTGNTDRGIDHRDRGIRIQHQQEMAVQIDHRAHADDALQVGFYPAVAAQHLFAAGFPGLRQVHPRRGIAPLDRLAGAGVGDAESHVGPVRGHDLDLVCAGRFGEEFDGHALAGDAVLTRLFISGCLLNGFGLRGFR